MRSRPDELAGALASPPAPRASSSPREASGLFSDHDDRTAVIVGSGTSLRGFTFSDLNDSRFVTFAINAEAWNNRDDYAPDFWIFCDDHVGMAKAGEDLHPRTRVLTKTENFWKLSNGRVAKWLDRVHVFDAKRDPNWSMRSPWMPMWKTTATAATALAARMGHRRIVLLGVDCFGSKSLGYYHDGRQKRRMPVTREDGDLYVTKQHEDMLDQWRIVADGLNRWGGIEVIQTSMLSPLTLFEKRPWREAVK